jgi:hypothetical protein
LCLKELNDFEKTRKDDDSLKKPFKSSTFDIDLFRKAVQALLRFMENPLASPDVKIEIDKLEDSKIFHERQLMAIF